MDQVSRLALEANNETTTLRKGRIVHVDGIPYELLDDVEAYSATDAAAMRSGAGNDEGETNA